MKHRERVKEQEKVVETATAQVDAFGEITELVSSLPNTEFRFRAYYVLDSYQVEIATTDGAPTEKNLFNSRAMSGQ